MVNLQSHRRFLAEVKLRQSHRYGDLGGDPGFAPSWANYSAEEETIRNDYSERYLAGYGNWPSHCILGARDEELCEEYPALRRLMDLKTETVGSNSSSAKRVSLFPSDIICSSSTDPHPLVTAFHPQRFDAILISPPLESNSWNWENTSDLPVRALSSDPGFVFLWVGRGDTDGLERGRECLAKWGFRRCEDLIFVKRNRQEQSGRDNTPSDAGVLTSQKEHCLMGIRGTVRRAMDSWFVHCNVDVDTYLWDNGSDDGASPIPPYLYTLIENFCLGTRRLELFARETSARRGWVAAGFSDRAESSLSGSAKCSETSEGAVNGLPLIPFNPEIDSLRPKSPIKRAQRPRVQYDSPSRSPLGQGTRPVNFHSPRPNWTHFSPKPHLLREPIVHPQGGWSGPGSDFQGHTIPVHYSSNSYFAPTNNAVGNQSYSAEHQWMVRQPSWQPRPIPLINPRSGHREPVYNPTGYNPVPYSNWSQY